MTTVETINFIAILITFLTTLLGWIFTYRMQRVALEKQVQAQRELADLQEQSAINREKRQHIIPDRLNNLKEIASWFNQGLVISSDAGILLETRHEFAAKSAYWQLHSSFFDRYRVWSDDWPEYHVIAQQYDPNYPPASEWEKGSNSPPDNLPEQMDAFFDEITAQANALNNPSGRMEADAVGVPLISIHSAAIEAIERIRQHIISNA